MKRRDFLKGAAVATAIISVPAIARQKTYNFNQLFGPSPFPNPIYHSLAGPLVQGIIRPLEADNRFTKQCAGTHYGYCDPFLIEIKPTYTQAEVDQICAGSLEYLSKYGFIAEVGIGYALWFTDYYYKPGFLNLSHHGSAKGRRWQYGDESTQPV